MTSLLAKCYRTVIQQDQDRKPIQLLNEKQYSVELGVAATVTTYFMTAACPFHDSVYMCIESKFIRQPQNQLRNELENGLAIYDENNGKSDKGIPQLLLDFLR
ncbi:hypothetical protein HBH98_248060 [Parastagonospora nodorum]|nr:hypothetical protein HBH53_253510 [Parastagonospora nodorum]KAH3956201.1 hypothetical protein HBH51_248600 [Parastagonospora nodorum]KAH4215419.1 hypothetical protein HBI06_252810 [Parastagonospora nodorum]KAH4223578.1 hypothetical protein HBI05_247730 [Parastagonospora nodorum]KAH4333513.1 hypothetical protein HBH98_248060 [Parastagonospora nodorum]